MSPEERVILPGPVGDLEARLSLPASPLALAVVCHPHPLFEGSLDNKVVHYLVRTLAGRGAATLRFNFRGVGDSAGTWDEGRGEVEDAVAAVDWLRNRLPGLPLWLGGFSFGAWAALQAAPRCRPERMVVVAPPVSMPEFLDPPCPACPWVLIQGGGDEVVDAAATGRWARACGRPPNLVELEGAGHFFHGRLNDLREGLLQHWV